MKKLFTLLTLALISIGSAWGSNTDLISGITLPDVPASTIDLSSQTDFTPNAYGWIVFNPYASLSSKTYWSNNSGNKTGTTWDVPDGANAPFVGSSTSVNVHTLRNNRSYALRFTGAEAVSFLVKAASDTKKAIVSLYSYSGTTHTAVGSAHECTSTDATEIYISGLSTSTTYIAYIYSNNDKSNSFVMEIGLKVPVTTYTVTYKANGGTGDDVVDNAAAAVSDCPNTFTAPSGKAFVGWNTTADGAGTSYAVGASITSNLTLYAQWATSHTVTYSLGGGSGTVPTQDDLAEGADFTVAAAPGDLVAPTGKEFKCWNDGTTDYDAGDTYTMGTNNVTLTAVYQDKTYKGLTPSATLDLSDASNFSAIWFTNENKMTNNFYYDAPNGVVAISAYAAYQAKDKDKISWMTTDSGNSNNASWDATGVFKGSSYYFASENKVASVQNTTRIHYYRVTNCSGVSALVGGKAIMEVYEVSAGVVTPDPVNDSSVDAEGTITISGLNTSKEYIIAIRGNNGTSNVAFREIAFNFPAVATTSVSVSSYKWATFCSDYALDFTGSDVKAYIVTGDEGSAITKQAVTTVAAGTPLLLNASEGDHNITIAAEGDDYSTTNKLQRGAGTLTKADSGSNWVLAVDGGKAMFLFIDADNATVPTNKAYLHLDSEIPAGEARSLFLDDDVTGIKNIKVGSEDNIYYDLQGRRVLYPTKGLYIVNGKKVILK